ncbi:MAG: hypothetical protein ACOH2M_31420 [Cypionkella sp.]
MQVLRSFDRDTFAPVGLSIRAMVIGSASRETGLAERLAGLGSSVDAVADLFTGMEAVIEDPAGYGLCVIDCDQVGGLELGRRAYALMGNAAQRVPVILVSSECTTQEFPQDRFKPVVLRNPASKISMRMGFEHALRDRFLMQFS